MIGRSLIFRLVIDYQLIRTLSFRILVCLGGVNILSRHLWQAYEWATSTLCLFWGLSNDRFVEVRANTIFN